MAEIIATGLLKSVFAKLASEAFKAYARSQGIHSALKKLERTLTQIQSLLNDASQKEITDEAVKQWLNGLQHLAYDIDDLLDELATDAMHREFSQQSGAITSKVRRLVPTFVKNLSLSRSMHHKLDDITTKFEDLLNENTRLGLSVKGEKPKRSYQTSLIDTSGIVGRQEEKKKLLIKLFEDRSSSGQNFTVVPIVGMGGLGKTTLARLLYDDEEVKKHFELKAWVYVSDQFDIFNISKVILQSVKGENKDFTESVKGEDKNFTDLNLLQIALRNQFKEKRFLIILDDVWSESYEDWETLVSPFHACAPGSKVIMTTRKVQLLNKLGYNDLNYLHTLSYDDAVSLFAQHALGTNNFDSHPILRPYGEGIVKKCDGLPLALRVLGRLLRTKTEEEEWKELFNSDIWKLGNKDEIVPALRLSYHDLSACLKQLFAYFSLLPKGYRFYKPDLIVLWMAEGFLHESSSKKSMERLGDEYFEELLSRSMFQHAPNHKGMFVVHDLLNDLATFVAGELFIRLDDEMVKDDRKEALEKYRHMSFVNEEYVAYSKFKPFERAKSLRTFLAFKPNDSQAEFYLSSKILVDLLPRLPMLRVLCLNDYRISELTESIGSLKHLQYLDLAETLITQLPESVCNLYNLQTLSLSGCSKLSKLPNNFSKLKMLRHLAITNTPLLNELPSGIGQLKSLQSLSKIILGGDNGFTITMLKDLTNLTTGGIQIKGLEKVEMVMHAQEANLLQKRFVWLELEWSEVFDGSRKESLEKEVLSVLKPHSDSLEWLKITSYGGMEFPNWVGDPSFLQLLTVHISGCKNCTSLPPLGQLPSLKWLYIEDMDEVKVMGSDLNGIGLAFRSLIIFELQNMKRLEAWSTNGVASFPCLEKLLIRNCPELGEVSIEELPSLSTLQIGECDSGVLRRLVQAAPSVKKLTIQSISGLNDVVLTGVMEYLGEAEELILRDCNEIRNLEVRNCQKLVRLGETEEDCGSSNLMTTLMILNCQNMEHCRCPNNIENLDISDCPSMTSVSFPTKGQKLKSLLISSCHKLLDISDCPSRVLMINSQSMPVLQFACLLDWPDLKSIIELSHFIHLTSLSIGGCPNLESIPDHELPNLTLLTHLVIFDCPRLDASFPRGFWPPKMSHLKIGRLKQPILDWGPQNFPTSLVDLVLWSGEEDGVSRCSQMSHLIPSSLTSLELINFKKLQSLSVGLQHLTSLQHLFLDRCPKIRGLPGTLLPSLLSLKIDDCPCLEGRCSRRGGSYWSRISHIPCIRILNIRKSF